MAGFFRTLSAGLLLAATAADGAEYGPFRVAAVEIHDFAGALDVRVRPGESVRVTLDATPEAVETFEARLEGDRLVVRGPRRSSSSTVVVGDVTVFSGGGDASVVIGGTPAGTPPGPPPKLDLDVPPGTGLVIENVTGEVVIGDLGGPLSFAMTAGSARIGRVGATRIELRGSGDVRIAAVTDRLEVAIEGSGLVEVAGGRVDTFSGTISGSGDIRFHGTARRARAEILGAGTIGVHEVLEEPDISVVGTGSVAIDRRS
jgi:hypothetical protein